MTCERGFAAPIMLALLVIVAFACMATADAANVLVTALRARAAADAAALAAAVEEWSFAGMGTDPAGAASRLAEANGATLESCDCPLRGAEAIVTVSAPTRVRMLHVAPARVHATARAKLDPGAMFRPAS